MPLCASLKMYICEEEKSAAQKNNYNDAMTLNFFKFKFLTVIIES